MGQHDVGLAVAKAPVRPGPPDPGDVRIGEVVTGQGGAQALEHEALGPPTGAIGRALIWFGDRRRAPHSTPSRAAPMRRG
jgi:hypothetical protein